jgi:hypothetical protein
MSDGDFWKYVSGGVQVFDSVASVEDDCVVTQWLARPGEQTVGGSVANVRQALLRMIERQAGECRTTRSLWMCVNAETMAKLRLVDIVTERQLACGRLLPGNGTHLTHAQVTIAAMSPEVAIVPQGMPLTLMVAPMGEWRAS